MRHRISLATLSLRISAWLYMLTGVLLLVMMAGRGSAKGSTIGILLFLFCLALAVGIWLVVGGLNKRKFWAWVAGLGIFAIYLPSLFLPPPPCPC